MLPPKSRMNISICKEIILKLYIHNNITPAQHLAHYILLMCVDSSCHSVTVAQLVAMR